ncbi:MAG: pilus assembly protein [Deltaproteobacteria bacterium]|nr:pilus assembly protein [Deltaproteobacteria bacterium]
MRRLRLKDTRGQAITEFAIALPTMVIIFMFSQYFYEAIQVKLKAQEMARYGAWEFTGHALHDYDDGEMRYSTVSSSVQSDANQRFSNLNSTDKRSDANRAFAGEWTVNNLRTRDLSEPRIPGGTMANTILTIAGYLLDAWRLAAIAQHPNIIYAAAAAWFTAERNTTFGMAAGNVFNPPSEWKMNGRGLIKSQSTVVFRNVFIPKKIYGLTDTMVLKPLRFREKHVILADSWKLHYGDDVLGNGETGSTDTAFFKQVDRMVLVRKKPREIFKVYTDIVRIMTNIVATLAFQPWLTMNNLGETTLVSKNYNGGSGNEGSGRIELDTDNDTNAPLPFDTAPNIDAYQDSLKTRDNNYMGCREPESLGCTSSLSSDNPFGDYIVPEEIE